MFFVFLPGDCRPVESITYTRDAQNSTNRQCLPEDGKKVLAGIRGLQATTEGNKATRITAVLIQVDPGNLGVARVVGIVKQLLDSVGPQMNRNHVRCTRTVGPASPR